MLISVKLGGLWYLKVYFLKLHMCMYLRAKFEVSSIILTSFRKELGGGERGWVILSPPTQNEPLKRPTRLGG